MIINKFILLFLLVLPLVIACSDDDAPTGPSTDVIEGDVSLSTQAEVNSFAGTYITGSLTISGSDIVDLTPLSTLDSLGGDLLIEVNVALKNLNGLSNLTSVGGNLLVSDNAALNIFCGLYPLLSSNGLQGGYDVTGNLVNPTQQQIIDDGPCIP